MKKSISKLRAFRDCSLFSLSTEAWNVIRFGRPPTPPTGMTPIFHFNVTKGKLYTQRALCSLAFVWSNCFWLKNPWHFLQRRNTEVRRRSKYLHGERKKMKKWVIFSLHSRFDGAHQQQEKRLRGKIRDFFSVLARKKMYSHSSASQELSVIRRREDVLQWQHENHAQLNYWDIYSERKIEKW